MKVSVVNLFTYLYMYAHGCLRSVADLNQIKLSCQFAVVKLINFNIVKRVNSEIQNVPQIIFLYLLINVC